MGESILAHYGFVGLAGTVAASGAAGVGASVIVAVSHNTIKAAISENNTISGKNINVEAESNRNIMTFASTVGVGGTAGVAPSVIVIVAGTGIDKDS